MQILARIKGEVDSSTIIVEDFNTPLTSMDRLPRQNWEKLKAGEGNYRGQDSWMSSLIQWT